jgi:NAD(P)-dependent dehydrogenase (short-subunit alcohol dehydrogenase family)
VAADLTRAEEVEAMVAQVEREFGPVDVLVANAGGSSVRPGPIEDIGVEDWRASVDANLTATFLSVKYVLPGMKERGRGVIITMASAASRRPHPGSPVAYAAAKAGIEIFTQDLAAQAGPHASGRTASRPRRFSPSATRADPARHQGIAAASTPDPPARHTRGRGTGGAVPRLRRHRLDHRHRARRRRRRRHGLTKEGA